MNDPRCNQLDEYLCGLLSPNEAAEFERHLANCQVCREERELQGRIDRVLADENAFAATVPAGLRSRVDRGVRTKRRRRMLSWAGAAAAALSVAAALTFATTNGLFFTVPDQAKTDRLAPVGDNSALAVLPPVHVETPAVVVAQVAMLDPESAIAVPIESHSPNVTLVQIYPTFCANMEGESPDDRDY
jgi:anti-sigma factor RsiW